MNSELTILVSDPKKQYAISPGPNQSSSSFVDYKIEVKLNGKTCEVRRRFKEFAFLHSFLRSRIPGSILPLLPDKGLSSQISKKTANDQMFLETRAKV